MDQETKLKLLGGLEAIHRKIKEVRECREKIVRSHVDRIKQNIENEEIREYYEKVTRVTQQGIIFNYLEEEWAKQTVNTVNGLYERAKGIKNILYRYAFIPEKSDYRYRIEPLKAKAIAELTDFSFLDNILKQEEDQNTKFIKSIDALTTLVKEIREIEYRYE